MEATRAHFGERVSIAAAANGLRYWLENSYWSLEEVPRQLSTEEARSSRPKPPHGPFKRADFGKHERLSWPAGACGIAPQVAPTYWGERYAMWNHEDALVVVDAAWPTIMHVSLPGLVDRYRTPELHDDILLFQQRENAVWFATAAFEALFVRPAGTFDVTVRELYPRRVKSRTTAARIEDLTGEVTARRLDKQRLVRFPAVQGLQRPMDVTLHDEIVPDVFLEIDVPGQPRQTLRTVRTTSSVAGEVRHEPAVDPAGTLVRPTTAPLRQADLDRLYHALADDPADDATRLVVVDALEELGLPHDPLGTLASYLFRIEAQDGVPYGAPLSSIAPLEPEIGDVVVADQRLGLFHTLRIGDGNFSLYARLVASPRAVGLRHVDVPRIQVLNALIAGQRRELRRLSGVKFVSREMIDGLADSTFDRVRELETETLTRTVPKLLEFIIRDETKFFARAPRHLILTTRNGDTLVSPVLAAWDRLPVDQITFDEVTLSRDGTAVALETAFEFIVDEVRARFPKLVIQPVT